MGINNCGGKSMSKFDKGCVNYLIVPYELQIAFPSDMVICDLCPMCRTENSGTRFRCNETGEILPYHNKGTGMRCPLPIPEKEAEPDDDS